MDSQEGGISYEDVRKQRLEENKKRMQELGLADLSKNLSNGIVATKTTPQARQVKPRVPKEFAELRRSSRVASNPAPDYREVNPDISLGRRSYSSRASSLLNRKYASDEARLDAALQAENIMKDLPRSSPSFVKPMLQSHVTGGFWLGLPSMFCKTYLPKKDDKVILENEKGDEWETVFLANKAGLSGGWRGFSLDHGLVDGDALVFELVEHCRFKIHIVRAYEEAQDEDVQEQIGDGARVPKGETGIVQKYKLKKQEQQDLEETEPQAKKKKRKQKVENFEDLFQIEESQKYKSKKQEQQGPEETKPQAKKKRKQKEEDFEDLFQIEESPSGNRITSFMRAGRPHRSVGISVC